MKEHPIKGINIDVWYNIYDQMIYLCKFYNYVDGNRVYFDIEDESVLDLYNFDLHGYKKVLNNGGLINALEDYLPSQLKKIEDSWNERERRKEIPSENLRSLAAIQDSIKENAFNYDERYPVESLEIRYNPLIGDFMIVKPIFDREKKRFSYISMDNGTELAPEILEFYGLYPRDAVFRQPDYSPRELIDLRHRLNEGVRSMTRGK